MQPSMQFPELGDANEPIPGAECAKALAQPLMEKLDLRISASLDALIQRRTPLFGQSNPLKVYPGPMQLRKRQSDEPRPATTIVGLGQLIEYSLAPLHLAELLTLGALPARNPHSGFNGHNIRAGMRPHDDAHRRIAIGFPSSFNPRSMSALHSRAVKREFTSKTDSRLVGRKRPVTNDELRTGRCHLCIYYQVGAARRVQMPKVRTNSPPLRGALRVARLFD